MASTTILPPNNTNTHIDDDPRDTHENPISPSPRLPPAIEVIPPPWRLKGDIYCISFWTRSLSTTDPDAHLPAHAYSPLEAADDDFARPPGSRPRGGLGMIQLIRYHDSPVGPYDEMLLVPGSFGWTRRGPGGRLKRGCNPRISRMYVSQEQSCHNGRVNWGCPKHLARFEWIPGPNDSLTVSVYPHDADASDESRPSATPFFTASWAPIARAPAFPFATRWLDWLGCTTTIVMPPLPEGKGSRRGELPGTDRWFSFAPSQYSRRTRLAWFDLAQSGTKTKQQQQQQQPAQKKPAGSGQSQEGRSKTKHAKNVEGSRGNNGAPLNEYENFWPGLGRWHLGMIMEDADVICHPPLETWAPDGAPDGGAIRANL